MAQFTMDKSGFIRTDLDNHPSCLGKVVEDERFSDDTRGKNHNKCIYL